MGPDEIKDVIAWMNNPANIEFKLTDQEKMQIMAVQQEFNRAIKEIVLPAMIRDEGAKFIVRL